MTSSETQNQELPPLRACTVSRDVQEFDLLIEDMETVLGDTWGDLSFAEARSFFEQPEAASLEFIALTLNSEDEEKTVFLSEIIKSAKAKKIDVIVVAEDVSPATLHQLLSDGAYAFLPYPLAEGELAATVEKLSRASQEPQPAAEQTKAAVAPAPTTDKAGVIIATHGLAGGTGATTLAVNLGWELATLHKKEPNPSVCVIDLDLQQGSVATYLDLPRLEPVFELWSDTESMDAEMFRQALVSFEETLSVFTAPPELIPLDLITNEDVERVLDLAATQFDYVIVDVPKTLVNWSEVVLRKAPVYFATLELDMRSAQNALRLKRALAAEDLPAQKLRYTLNRAPKFTDLNGKSRVKRMAESLDISIDLLLPDGGKPVTQGGDHGLPLASTAAKNPLRKEIAKLAAELHALGQDEAQAA